VYYSPGSASDIQDVPRNTVTASYLAVESSFAPSTPQVVLLEILSRFHSKYDEETIVEQNELPFHVLEKLPSVLKNYIAELYEEEKHRKSPSNEHC
jgi:hypothetical protein